MWKSWKFPSSSLPFWKAKIVWWKFSFLLLAVPSVRWEFTSLRILCDGIIVKGIFTFSFFFYAFSFFSLNLEWIFSLVMLFGNVHDDDDDDDSEWGGITVVWFLYRKLMGGGGSFRNLRLDFIKIKISERFHENYKLNIWLENSNIQRHVILRFSPHQSTYFDTFCQRNEKKILECELKTKKNFFFYELKSCLALANEMSVVTLYVCVYMWRKVIM